MLACSVRLVEVSLFKEGIFDRVQTRRWEPHGDLLGTAKEMSKYIADSGSEEAQDRGLGRSLRVSRPLAVLNASAKQPGPLRSTPRRSSHLSRGGRPP